MYLIAGLGNPGQEYKDTRHNIGYQVITMLSQHLGVHLFNKRFKAKDVQVRLHEKEVILLCPETYMNLSGSSIKDCINFFGIHDKDILIIHDDLDLPTGKIKAVKNGGAGGHRGVLSIIEHLGSNEFSRIKIGIGRPRYGESIEDYVLSSFYEDERDIIKKVLPVAIKACLLFVAEGIESLMNHVNCLSLISQEINQRCLD